MYDYHYNYIKRKSDAKLLFTDTDSLTYKVKAEDIYEIFYKCKDLFDFSNYPKDSKFYDPCNMNEIGQIKDESEGKIVLSCWIKVKNVLDKNDIYGKENKKRKGVNSVVVENTRYREYLDVLITKKIMRHIMKRIQSKFHKIGT